MTRREYVIEDFEFLPLTVHLRTSSERLLVLRVLHIYAFSCCSHPSFGILFGKNFQNRHRFV
ncbi:uncharacterized protein LOC110225672 [Arabidopsis lyrata subsp. lyrata]|uniref:uncharacterized protein LOC110225672 n=1 Tax=Arabidopsis lyrata subsp. lyrata TaxID=81972 RepID=UPI000A29CC54|nr:uncharacterized protein LOC110225672 [Arabidopsis lyrata subsp. lyrata]|eukprot:XP_020871201.1 uncharacterized protein LOC110225672 [Arabidopsis lyrata subsp. lyrata]